MQFIVLVVAPVSLALSLFIETSSWWVRAQAPSGAMGLYVSRSNIYLYGGRFFSVAFTALTAFWIENGASPQSVAFTLAASLALAALLQLALFHHFGSFSLVMSGITFALRLPSPEVHPPKQNRAFQRRLFGATAFSSCIFGLGIGLPLLAAVLVPKYRLSVSYLGQVVNSLATLVVLLLVDQLLFRALDSGTLPGDVKDYSRGRIAGFILAALAFGLAGWLI